MSQVDNLARAGAQVLAAIPRHGIDDPRIEASALIQALARDPSIMVTTEPHMTRTLLVTITGPTQDGVRAFKESVLQVLDGFKAVPTISRNYP